MSVGKGHLLSVHRRARLASRRFPVWLGAIVGVALLVRLGYALGVAGRRPLLGDAAEFQLLARHLADGLGYIQPALYELTGEMVPTAFKPPLYPLLLAAPAALGFDGYVAGHVVTCLCGAGAVAACGLVARRVGGDRVGLIAAALAAVYPVLVAADASLRSESLLAMLTGFALLAALRLADRQSLARAGGLGALLGLAALTRAEALVALPLLALPAVWPAGKRGRRAGVAAAVAGACLIVLTPWLARNWTTFDRPVPISTNTGGVLAGANCDATYSGPLLGQWSPGCIPSRLPRNDALASDLQRDKGFKYARDHLGRLPTVLPARVGRTWSVFRPRRQTDQTVFFEGRDPRMAKAAAASFYAIALLAIVGALLLRRRPRSLLLLLALPASVTVSSLLAYGDTRFRAAAEVSLVILAAFAVSSVVDRVERSARGSSS